MIRHHYIRTKEVFAHCDRNCVIYNQEMYGLVVWVHMKTYLQLLAAAEFLRFGRCCNIWTVSCYVVLCRIFRELYIIAFFHTTGMSNTTLYKTRYITCVNLDSKHGPVSQISCLKALICRAMQVNREC